MTTDSKDIEGLGEKARTLNDSLKTLSNDGFDKLARAVGQAAVGASTAAARKPAGEIVNKELSRLLQQEVSATFRDMMTGSNTGMTGGGYSVVINNNTGAAVSTAETTDSMDQKQLEISIDQMVANSLVRGRQTSGVMRTLFGIAPGLIGR